MFIALGYRKATVFKEPTLLAQTTISLDVVESVALKYGKAHVIKSHPNIGRLLERLTLRLNILL